MEVTIIGFETPNGVRHDRVLLNVVCLKSDLDFYRSYIKHVLKVRTVNLIYREMADVLKTSCK